MSALWFVLTLGTAWAMIRLRVDPTQGRQEDRQIAERERLRARHYPHL
jgi:hypothetical protein